MTLPKVEHGKTRCPHCGTHGLVHNRTEDATDAPVKCVACCREFDLWK